MSDDANPLQQDTRDELPKPLADAVRAGDHMANQYHKEKHGEPMPGFEDEDGENDQGLEAAASYKEGDVVEYGDGHVGIVLEVHTSDFTPPEEDADENSYEVGEDETIYVIARETGGFGYYTDADLSAGSFPETPDDPAGELADRAADEDIEARAAEVAGDAAVGVAAKDAADPTPLVEVRAAGAGVPGWIGFPPSWEKSEIPARVILLDAWTSMGASWTGAYETFQKGNTKRAAKKLASSMKDEVYGTTYWR